MGLGAIRGTLLLDLPIPLRVRDMVACYCVCWRGGGGEGMVVTRRWTCILQRKGEQDSWWLNAIETKEKNDRMGLAHKMT